MSQQFAFPGIWRRRQGPFKNDGPNVDIDVYSFMTTLPNALTVSINHKRSPVILTDEEQFETWLSGTPDEAFGLVKSFDPDRMRIVQKGFEKKDLLAAYQMLRFHGVTIQWATSTVNELLPLVFSRASATSLMAARGSRQSSPCICRKPMRSIWLWSGAPMI